MAADEGLGDRRTDVRFEIIGDVWCTMLETQTWPARDIGLDGVLVESAEPLIVGSLHRVRLWLALDEGEVTVAVRHLASGRSLTARYLLGLEFVDLGAETRERIAAFLGRSSRPSEKKAPDTGLSLVERRRTLRVRGPAGVRLHRASVTTARLLDIGCQGLLLLSSHPVAVGQYVHVNARLATVSIDGDVEVRHVTRQKDEDGAHRVGGRFVSLDQATRRAMQQILVAGAR